MLVGGEGHKKIYAMLGIRMQSKMGEYNHPAKSRPCPQQTTHGIYWKEEPRLGEESRETPMGRMEKCNAVTLGKFKQTAKCPKLKQTPSKWEKENYITASHCNTEGRRKKK